MHNAQCAGIFVRFFTHFAIVTNELNAVSGVDFTGAKITHVDTHFEWLNA